MARDHTGVRGRDQELTALRAALSGDTGRLLVVRGPAGVGRSALLDAATRGLPAGAPRVVAVKYGSQPEDRDDLFGIAPVLRALRDRFEQFGDLRLADSLNAVARLRDLAGQNPDWWVPRMITELGIMFDRIGHARRTALVVDDVHTVAEPALLLASARRSGCRVLVSCRDDAERTPGLAELFTMADEVITLGPLSDEDTEALVGRAAGTQLDESVVTALRTALGPLFGNPGTTLATLADLRNRDRLIASRDRLCLRIPSAAIALPANHHLLARAERLGEPGPALLSAVAVLEQIGVDELPLLAGAIEADLTTCGRVLDQLIAAEVLAVDEAGRVSARCPALAAAAAGMAGTSARSRLHARIAEQLLDRRNRGASVDPAALADHIARSGVALVLDESVLAWLLELAGAIEADRPERAARWYAAALRRMTPQEPEHARVLAILLGLVMRTGQYELLYEVLSRYGALGAGPASLPDLRAAAVLVAMHTAVPMPEATVRALLDEPAVDGEQVGFSHWWFGHRIAAGVEGSLSDGQAMRRIGTRELLSANQILLLRAALSGDPDACGRSWRRMGRPTTSPDLDRLREAASLVDMATVFEIVFGDRYRVPDTGVLSAYQRVVRGYAEADWSKAMSAVRELELSGSRDTLVHHAARLIAAEICSARGQYPRAAEWLADAANAPALAALRAWVEAGLLAGTGQARQAVRLARQTYLRLHEAGVRGGLERLLIRAVHIAISADDQEVAAELLGEIEDLHRQGACGTTMEIMFLARGMVHHDLVYTQVGTDLVRNRGDKPAVLEACLAVAQFADDPQAWLHEAYEIAGQCGSPSLREHVRGLIRERGVAAPRARGRRDTLSATEQRIIELIRDGLTNRQIALDIRVSEKTVENHLTRLFARTGCRSRVELAAASLEGRLLEVAS
jgi:DNA-binding CsgD family transcriptional regulator